MKGIILGATLLLATVPLPFAKAASSNCEPQLYAQVDLHIEPNGQVFLPISIGDKDVYFEMAMGNGLPLIAESVVGYLDLKPKRINGTGKFYGMTHFVPLEKMRIDGFKLADRAAPIIPQPEVTSLRMLNGRPVVGKMGSTLIQNLDAEVYLAERKFRLFKPFRCMSESPVYWGGEAAELPLRFDQAGTLVFTLELDGKKIDASMMTGDTVSTIDVNATRSFFGFDEKSPGIVVMPTPSGGSQNLFHAMSLTGQGLEIQNSMVRLRNGSSRCNLVASTPVYGSIGYETCINAVPFSLGTDLLSSMRIYFSKERKKVYITTVEPKESAAPATITVVPSR